MADNGMIGNGSKVAYRIVDSPLASWNEVGQILNVSGLELARDKINTTVHSANIYKRSAPGMADVSDLELELLANPDELQGEGITQQALITYLLAGTTVNWRVEVPTDRAQTEFKGYEFDGYVLKWSHGKPIEDRQTYNFAIAFDDSSFTFDAAGPTEIV